LQASASTAGSSSVATLLQLRVNSTSQIAAHVQAVPPSVVHLELEISSSRAAGDVIVDEPLLWTDRFKSDRHQIVCC